MYELNVKIDEWNRNALELFKISEPNENQEFFGVVRFYFCGPNGKYHSKCVRISSTATARHLVNVLVEKFHPDLRLLRSARYALYEYHPSRGERRLGAEERPLVNQIYWKSSQSEGRFILRDETKLSLKNLPQGPSLAGSMSSINMAKWKSAGNLMTETPSMEAYARSHEALANSSDELVFSVNTGASKKEKASSSAKKKTKSLKSSAGDGKKNKKRKTSAASMEQNQAMSRTASLPNFLDDQSAYGYQNRDPSDPHGGTLNIFLQSANLPDRSQTLKCTVFETTNQIIQRLLAIYGKSHSMDSYYLEQVSIPPKNESLPYSLSPRRLLKPDERPLFLLRGIQTRFPRTRVEFHLSLQQQDTSLSLQDDRFSPQPDYANIAVKKSTPQLVEVNPNGTAKTGRVLRFNLASLVGAEGGRPHSGAPIKVGSQFSAVGPPPNIVLSANRFPDIRPVHCTLLPASPSASASETVGASVLISPALDITLRPPGPTAVCLDGRKVVRPTALRHGCIIQLGRSLFLKFVEQGASLEKTRPMHSQAPQGSMPDLAFQGDYGEKYCSRTSINQPTYANTDALFPVKIPILVDVNLPPSARNAASKDDFAASLHEAACDAVDAILKLASSLSFHATTATLSRTGGGPRPPIFVLTPAFLLYGMLRGFLRRWRIAQLTKEQQEHYLSGLLNHIGSQMFQCIQACIQPDSTSWHSLRVTFNRLLFWLANSSELQHFLRNDVDFSEISGTFAHLLGNCIDTVFHELRQSFLELVKHFVPSLLFPGDFDQQDDVRLDDRPLSPNTDINLAIPATQEPNIQRLLQVLSYMMRGMRQACVNVSFALQFFAYVFHAMSAWTFNSIVQTEGGSRRDAQQTGGLWMTRLGAGRLTRRLQRVKDWAARHGLGSVCEVHMLLPVQTCQLITSDRSKFRTFQKRVSELRSLNSVKVEWILTHLGDPPAVPSEWVKNITKSVRQDVDREITEKHGSPSSRETQELLSLQSPVELSLPLIIPPEGYASTSGLRGIPEGFMEAIEPLIEDGCLDVRRNDAAFEPPLNGLWIGHFKFKPEMKMNQSGRGPGAPSELNIDRLAKEAGVAASTVKRLVLRKNGQPLGLGIVAAKPVGNAPYGIYIRHIVPESVAAQYGGLEIGDQILAIANSSLVNCDQSEAAVSILARITNAVHLVVAKRAAQTRGIMDLLNSAQSGHPLPMPAARSTQSLNRAARINREFEEDITETDDDDDEDDESAMAGAKFGSRTSLGNAVSQQSIFTAKMLESPKGPKIREFDNATEDEEEEESTSSGNGSDQVWQSNEKSLKPFAKSQRPSPPNGNLSFQTSPASVQGSLDNYKYRSQQDLRSSGFSTRPPSGAMEDEPSTVTKKPDTKNNKDKGQRSPSLSSLTSTSSLVAQNAKKETESGTKPSQEGVYTNASEATSDSEELLTNVRQRIPSASATTAEKNTSPLTSSPAKKVTDKAMQTVTETSSTTQTVTEERKSASVATVDFQVSAVQTEPMKVVEDPEHVSRYSPPLDRLPTAKPLEDSRTQPREYIPFNGSVVVEDVTKSVIDPKTGRFQQQQPQPQSAVGTLPKREAVTSVISYSDMRMPYTTTSVNTAPSTGRVEPSTIQSGVTYWSSQTDLTYTTTTTNVPQDASPPPEPTADFPQYHPPAALEPSELAIKFGDVGAMRSPSPPAAQQQSVSIYGPPASHYIPRRPASRESSPQRVDLIQRSRTLTASTPTNRAASLSRINPSESLNSQTRRLRELGREIRRLEDAVATNSSADLIRELDQLRVEYRFELQMNDRNRSRSLNTPHVRQNDRISPTVISPVTSNPRPYVTNGSTSAKPYDEFENERLERIRLQEQRSRIYEESVQPKNAHISPGKLAYAAPQTSVPPLQPKYTYQVESGPLYEGEKSPLTRPPIAPRLVNQTHQSPPAYSSFSDLHDSQLVRSSELRSSRKSVTFDTNLESVTLYTPPDTSSGKSSEPHLSSVGSSNKNARSTVIHSENQPISRIGQSTVSEIKGPQFIPNIQQPENAESLSFKDKMAFFARAIGEDMPKDRFKASQKERQIMNRIMR